MTKENTNPLIDNWDLTDIFLSLLWHHLLFAPFHPSDLKFSCIGLTPSSPCTRHLFFLLFHLTCSSKQELWLSSRSTSSSIIRHQVKLHLKKSSFHIASHFFASTLALLTCEQTSMCSPGGCASTSEVAPAEDHSPTVFLGLFRCDNW